MSPSNCHNSGFLSRRRCLRFSLIGALALAIQPAAWGWTWEYSFSESALNVAGLTVFPRSAWSALPVKTPLLRRAGEFNRITIHHAGNSVNTHTQWDLVVRDLNGVLDAHLQKQYGDLAYHFVIDYAGRVWEGRSLAFEGAHVADRNEGNIGVMLLGNFEKQSPAPAQICSLFALVQALRSKYSMSKSSIYGHCDLGQSVCPGQYLYRPFVAELRRALPADRPCVYPALNPIDE